MPFGCSGLCVPVAAALGAVALSAVAVYYFRQKRLSADNKSAKKFENRNIAASANDMVSAKSKLKNFPGQNLLQRIVSPGNKMVFVVNRPLLSNKQNLFLSVSTACLRCYKLAENDRSCDPFMKSWLRSGQMKVVLKCQSSGELLELQKKAAEMNLPCVLLKPEETKLSFNIAETKLLKPDTYLVACIVGPANNVDTVTGHLKLL